MKISNIAELKTRRGTTGFNVSVLGYYSAGDGGGGEFYWDNTSTETDNGGTIIKVTGLTTGRWKRRYSGFLNIKAFGVVEDGITDDSVFIQKAIDSVDSIEFNNKTYLTTSTISIKSDKNYYFRDSVFKNNSFTNTATATSLNNYILQGDSLSNCNLFGSFLLITDNSGNSCVTNGLFINEGTNINFNCSINIENLNFGILFKKLTNSSVYEIRGKNINGYQGSPSLGGDLLIILNSADVKISNVFGLNINKAGVYFSLDADSLFNDSISIDSIDIVLSNTAVSSALSIRKGKNIRVGNLFSRGGAIGLYLMLDSSSSDIRNINIDNINVKNNNQLSDNSYAVFLTSLYASNGNKKAKNINIGNIFSDTPIKGALIIDNCEDVSIGSIVSLNSTDDGIRIIGSNNIFINTVNIKSCLKNGIIINSTLSENLFFGEIFMQDLSNSYFGIRVDDNKAKDVTINSLYCKGTLPSYGVYYAIMNSVATGQNNVVINNTNITGFVNVIVYDYIFGGKIYTQSIPSHGSTIGKRGDIVYNTLPSSGGYCGWICTANGTAGTWKAFGLIA